MLPRSGTYRVPDHFIQLLNGIGDREDRLAERFGGVASLGRFMHDENDLGHYGLYHNTKPPARKR
jgi:hypothetical protein